MKLKFINIILNEDYYLHENIWKFKFGNCEIALFDTASNELLNFTCGSAIFEICDINMEDICLLNINWENSKASDYLFVPIKSVRILKILKFEEVSSLYKLGEQLWFLKDKGLINNCGFVLPLKKLESRYIIITENIVKWFE